MSLFAELKRRNVIKVSAAYLALGWIVEQATATLARFIVLLNKMNLPTEPVPVNWQ